jgi:hypothetical protein
MYSRVGERELGKKRMERRGEERRGEDGEERMERRGDAMAHRSTAFVVRVGGALACTYIHHGYKPGVKPTAQCIYTPQNQFSLRIPRFTLKCSHWYLTNLPCICQISVSFYPISTLPCPPHPPHPPHFIHPTYLTLPTSPTLPYPPYLTHLTLPTSPSPPQVRPLYYLRLITSPLSTLP